ncbi:MAG: hypothetical protein WC480_04585 [Patescibacteria group bacterium]
MAYCRNCQKVFELSQKERDFYHKLGTKEPSHCFDCRMQRKYAFRNERKLYNRQCDSCQQQIVSMYSADAPFPVYCFNCWWGDRWDAADHAQEIDFDRPFFSQVAELQQKIPRMCLTSTSDCVNSLYVNWTDRAKNCYLLYSSSLCEDCHYSEILVDCRDCLDCTSLKESENCYFSVDCQKCYNVKFSRNLKNCLDCNFCFDCADCQNCFLSYNLRHQQYCIRNVKFSPQNYEAEVNKIMSDRSSLLATWHEFLKTMEYEAIHKFANQVKCDEVEGDELYACQRAYNSFDSRELQDCFNIIYGDKIKDCADSFAIVDYSERCLEVFSSNGGYQNMYGYANWDNCESTNYCNSCISCRDCFGCIGLKHKQYCILNKQYTEEEYKRLVNRVINHMQKADYPTQGGKTEEWGEFYPMPLSPFAYNETMANIYYPLKKEEVLSRGWGWREDNNILTGKETVEDDIYLDNIELTDITTQVLKCVDCSRNYKIIKQELDFYQKHHLPVPKFCSECRFKQRLALRNPRKLWPRQCGCILDHEEHQQQAQCSTRFKTTYQPNRNEKVYCQECYQKEIY